MSESLEEKIANDMGIIHQLTVKYIGEVIASISPKHYEGDPGAFCNLMLACLAHPSAVIAYKLSQLYEPQDVMRVQNLFIDKFKFAIGLEVGNEKSELSH